LHEKIKENPHAFLRYSIAQERINYINALLSHEPDGKRSLFYLEIVLKSQVELGYTWPQVIGIENIEIFFDNCISQISEENLNIEALFKASATNVDIFSHFIILFFNRMQSGSEMEPFAKIFADILDSIESDAAGEARRRVYGLGGGKLLSEEFKNRLDKLLMGRDLSIENEENSVDIKVDEKNDEIEGKLKSDNNFSLEKSNQQLIVDYFNEYFKSVFSVIHEYYKNYFSEALKIYVSKLSNEYKYNECNRLILELLNNGMVVDDEAAGYLIKGFEEGAKIDFLDTEQEKMFTEVKKLKKTRHITSYPDITAMADFVIWLQKKTDSDLTIEEILNERLDIDKLDNYRYYKYLDWSLPEILKFAKTAEDHKRIIHYFQKEEDEKFFDKYLYIIINLINNNKEKGMRILQSFVVYFFFYLEPRYRALGEEAIIEKVRKSIIDVFNNNPRSFFKEFDYLIRKEFSDRGLSMPIQWSQIVNEISSPPQGGIFNKLSKIFKK
jgi:hypothetical protein